MKTLRLALLAAFVLFFVTCSDEISTTLPTPSKELLTPYEINGQIKETIEAKGDFNWTNTDDNFLWSALVNGDSILTIGYGKNIERDLKSAEEDIKQRIIDLVLQVESNLKSSSNEVSDVLIYEEAFLNVVDIKVSSLETIKMVRALAGVRYVEASGYPFFEYESNLKSSLSKGCDITPATINSSDYTNISPGSNVSWTYYKHNIPQAWQYSKGAGITVGLIDTGVSPYLSALGSGFSNSYSPNRSIQKYGTYVDSVWPWKTKTDGPNDKCGHGTRMAATIAAPMNSSYMPVGVANRCNLVSYRATKNVVLDGYHEQKGVAAALTQLANRSDVKIISMSIGHIFSVNRIKDAVKYAYSRGKLIFAAGGTSTSITNWVDVIFPANMSETVAVTGIKDNGYNECNTCHKGSKIDFTVIMQRSNDYDRVSVTLGFSNNEKSYCGGSSVSTATTAGIAALVWARHPTWNRDQVLAKLKQSADLYPNKHSYYGYGNIDALAAVQ